MQLECDSKIFYGNVMSNWFDPHNMRMIRFLEPRDIPHLCEITENVTFGNPCLRLIYQHFYDLAKGKIAEEDSKMFLMKIETNCAVERVLTMENLFFKTEMLKVILIHWKVTEENQAQYKNAKLKISKSLKDLCKTEMFFFNLLYLLHEAEVNKFTVKLDEYKAFMKNQYGDYWCHAVTPCIRLLLVTMKRYKMRKTIDFTIKKFPFVEYNSDVMKTIRETQEFQAYNASGQETYEELELLLKKFIKKSLTNYLFGRQIHDDGSSDLSLFEKTLSTPNSSKKINHLWKAFELTRFGFFLTLVSTKKQVNSIFFITSYILSSREIQKENCQSNMSLDRKMKKICLNF